MIDKYKNIFKLWIEKADKFFSGKKVRQKKILAWFFGIIFIFSLYLFLHTPPAGFPDGKIFSITSGESLEKITNNLYEAKIIRSSFVFRTTVILLGGEKNVIAGDYLLDDRVGPIELAYRMVRGNFHLDVVRITIPEGWNIYEISDYLSKTLMDFDKEEFVSLSRSKEGYLFPDTYFVSPAIKPEALIEKMVKTFNEKISSVPGLATSTQSLKDVITMASIVEREARAMESRKIIAGILWRRIKIGMPLQVDVSFAYINGKHTFNLTLADLKIDSPYNTYLYKGLPPGPIGNPGLDSILATINPTETKYLFFLTGHDGKMYYAQTFEQHKRNKALHLN